MTRVVNDDRVRTVRADNPKTGLLVHDAAVLFDRFPRVMARYETLIADNHATEFFTTPEFIDREIDERLEQLKRRRHRPFAMDEQHIESEACGENNPHGNGFGTRHQAAAEK